MFHFDVSGNFASCLLLGASKGILLGCISVVPLDMLGPSRLSTAMGIIACVYGLLATAQGPLHGRLTRLFNILYYGYKNDIFPIFT